ncbi:MAG TPA: RDD family protein, partial [Allocoleopsis sp.]
MPSSIPLTPVQFLTAANLVTAALQLYRQQFKPFFRLSAIAHLWLLLLLLSLAVIFLPGTLLDGESPLLVLLRIVGAGLVVWSGAKYLTLSAALSRLSFHQLLRWAESTQAAARYANKRLWGFWWIGFLTALLLFALAFGVILALSFIVSMASLVVGGFVVWSGGGSLNESASVVFGIFIVLSMLVLLTAAGLSLLWCVARLFIPEVAYAVEPELRPIEAIGRSWNLTNQNGWRMVGMIFVLFTVLLPLQVIYQVINGALQAGFVFLSPSDSETSSVFLASLVGSYALSLVFNCFMLPVWQATKAIAYYDLRIRREGMGLDAFDSSSASSSASGSPNDLLDDLLDANPVDSGTLSSLQAPPPDSVMGLFNRVKLLTPESVELEFMLAGLGSRALALTIDYGIVLTGVLLFWAGWGWLAYQLMSYLEGTGANYNPVSLWLLAIGLLATFIFTTGYFAGFEVLRQGQTPGKRFARIRVIRDDGRPVGV